MLFLFKEIYILKSYKWQIISILELNAKQI